MAQTGLAAERTELARRALGARAPLLFGLSLVFVIVASVVPDPILTLAFLLSGVSLALVLGWLAFWPQGAQAPALDGAATRQGLRASVEAVLENDPAAVLITGPENDLLFANRVARDMLPGGTAETLEAALEPRLAQPAAVLRRLRMELQDRGSVREDLVGRVGHLRLSAQVLDRAAGRAAHRILWRLEELGGPLAAEGGALPMLSLGRGNAVLYMNDAARDLAGGRVRHLEDLVVEGPEDPERAEGRVVIRTASGTEERFLRSAPRVGGRREVLLLPADRARPVARGSELIWSMVDALPVPILRLSVEGEIELANAAACQLLSIGPRPDAVLGELMEGLGRSIPEWLAEAAGQPVDGQSKPHSEFLRLSHSEREVFVQVAVKPVVHEGRSALIAVLSDATELKTLEAQFVQSQKMQAIGQLAGGVAHDFNNLLTAITGHCDLLLLRHDPGDPDYADLIQVNQNANRAASLVGQLLAFSRKQTLRPEPLDLRDTLSDLTHLLNRLVGEKVTLSLSHDPLLPQIRADKRQLEQVLMNLVVNARDAMPEGGEIRIQTELLHLDGEMRRDRAVVAPGEYVQVRVSDTGHGIPPDKLPKVFEPFFTTKRVGEGTGLGLSTAYGIIKQSGGFIFIDSTPGEGTCFTLLFPAREAEASSDVAPAGPVEAEMPARAEGVVLLVEDEAPVRAFAGRALRLRGYDVLEAESGEQALELLAATDRDIDIFVTDVIMPGMDGPSWVREALKTRPETRVVFVSGYAEDSFADSARRIHGSVFLPKPFSLAELTETVQRQLARGAVSGD
ncbi:ATP-binding protein [Pseudooceanicola marinus]|uniref:hybrid sensor histidine kinase/response regulator n=1 Tax=Pseudooceanicola marinus TaxID=396013 RepID=UPI001CD63593|nr:ATP-binding protein [Pseudooceanicola marinus]MCA1334244.1 response regulator [Pseudooceanicola marinus]